MAVIEIKELGGGRRGRRGEIGRRNHIRRFWLKTDTRIDDSKVILDSLPQLYESHPTDTKAIVVDANCDSIDNSFTTWIGEVEYSTEYTRNKTPLQEPPDIDIDFETRQEAVTGAYQRAEDGTLTKVGLCN